MSSIKINGIKKTEKERRDVVKTKKKKERPIKSYKEYMKNKQTGTDSENDDEEVYEEPLNMKFVKKEVKLIMDDLMIQDV